MEAASTVDLEGRFKTGVVDWSLGVNNVFDELPTELAKTHLSNILWGIRYPVDTPFGIAGRFGYLRLGFEFGSSMAATAFSTAVTAAREGKLDALGETLAASPDVLRARDGDGRALLDHACRAATGDIAIPLDPGTPGSMPPWTRSWPPAPTRRPPTTMAGRPCTPPAWPDTPTSVRGSSKPARRSMRRPTARPAVRRSPTRSSTPKAYMGEVLTPVYPDNLRAAAALGNDIGRFVDGDALAPEAYEGLDFYAPVFFPTWERTKNRQEVLDEALSWAARNNQCESMATLVDIGANVNANPFRGTPLLWACYSDKVDAARWLLDHGADPDLRHDWGGDGHGVSAVAMHLAAQHGAIGCLTLLLDRGADPTIIDGAHGGDPLGWAEFSGATEAAELLRGSRT